MMTTEGGGSPYGASTLTQEERESPIEKEQETARSLGRRGTCFSAQLAEIDEAVVPPSKSA